MASVAVPPVPPVHSEETDSQLPGRRTGQGAESLWDHLNRDTRRKAAAAGTLVPAEGGGDTPLDDCLKLHRTLVVEEQELVALIADLKSGRASELELQLAHASVLALRELADNVMAAALAHLRRQRGA
jgi:hypothetical protein